MRTSLHWDSRGSILFRKKEENRTEVSSGLTLIEPGQHLFGRREPLLRCFAEQLGGVAALYWAAAGCSAAALPLAWRLAPRH